MKKTSKKKFGFLLIALLLLIGVGVGLRYWWENGHRELVLYGNVDIRQVDLGFRVNGLVTELLVQEGDPVTPGMLVATLDEQPYLDEVLGAEADVVAAKVSLENAKLVYDRRKALVGSTAVSRENYDDALAQLDVAQANYDGALARLGVAKTNLADTQCYAPTNGTILTRIREPGSVVVPSQPVLTVSIDSPVWVRAYVSEPNLGRIYPGMRGRVSTDTPGGKVYEGHIGFISPVAEFTPKTVQTTDLRTDLVYRLRLIVDDPDRFLRQGMPVTVTFPNDIVP